MSTFFDFPRVLGGGSGFFLGWYLESHTKDEEALFTLRTYASLLLVSGDWCRVWGLDFFQGIGTVRQVLRSASASASARSSLDGST